MPSEKVVRELHSSSTTGQQPSRIVIDKTTAFRQARALASILKEHLGSHRRPFLVLDAPESAAAGDSLTARVRLFAGWAISPRKPSSAWKSTPTGDLAADWPAIEDFFAKHHGQEPVLLFGFTFMVWTRFVEEAERRGVKFQAPEAILLALRRMEKTRRPSRCRKTSSLAAQRCVRLRSAGHSRFLRHGGAGGHGICRLRGRQQARPGLCRRDFRRPLSLEPVDVGQTGIIEVLSVLPTSYPGQALITEDQGVLVGVDDCPCGRKGNYFRFTSRIEQAEIRGCGDTFAQAREIR